MKFIILTRITLFACRIAMLCDHEVNIFRFLKSAIIFTVTVAISGALIIFSLIDFDKVISLKTYKHSRPSILLDRKGRIISKYFKDNRQVVEAKLIPHHLKQAFIATEDNHFYEHFGIDPQAILRAFLVNLQAGGVKQGGSTITQQLAKVVLTSRKRNIFRKAKEAFMALVIECMLTKEEILNKYMNEIYFGHGNYGVQAASQFYFKKNVKDISVGEAAVIASLPSAPSRFAPFKHPRRSLNRTAHVLTKMIDMNFISRKRAKKEFISIRDYYSTLNVAPTVTAFGRRTDLAPYFTEYLRQKLEKEFGEEQLYTGGLKIYSSLDLDHQKAAQKALWPALKRQSLVSKRFIPSNHLAVARAYTNEIPILGLVFDLPEFRIKRNYTEYAMQVNFFKELADSTELVNLAMGGQGKLDNFLNQIRSKNPYLDRYQSVQGAFTEIDQLTGEVTVMVGGSPFSVQNQLNRAVNIKRQPGSAFKPLIYASSMQAKKITAASVFPDSPIIKLDFEGQNWNPGNYSGGFRGDLSVRQALAYSSNSVSIRIAEWSKLGNIIPIIAKQLHVNKKLVPRNLSIALGTFDVSPLQIAAAFSIFPRGGIDIEPVMLHKIVNSEGEVIRDYDSTRNTEFERILSQGTATVMINMMQGVVNSGTGRGAKYSGYAAGKTGTTQNFRDAWFVGFNERYTSALWMGYDLSTLSLGIGQSGGGIAAPVWGRYQQLVLRHRRGEKPHILRGEVTKLKVCKFSGKIQRSDCSSVCTELVEEVFAKDNLPEKGCTEVQASQEINIKDSGVKKLGQPKTNEIFVDEDI